MFVFVLHVRSDPQANARYPQGYSEAYVSCWVNDSGRENALRKAVTEIQARGWSVTEVIEDYPISREDYSLKPEGLEYYEQALIDGEVFVFYVPENGSGAKQE
jgi:hypothetical protein